MQNSNNSLLPWLHINNPQDENDSEDDGDDDEHAIIVGESLNDDVDNVDEKDVVDPDVLVDVDQAIIENEAKLLAAAKHVVMARAQRTIFQQAVKQAREDASSKDTSDII
jgi:fructose-specific component phosphotransferase system IIB-like protein